MTPPLGEREKGRERKREREKGRERVLCRRESDLADEHANQRDRRSHFERVYTFTHTHLGD